MNEVFYNVTVSLDPSIEQDWLQWMKEQHIPDVLATGMFLQSKILRVRGFEENGATYAIQYRLASNGFRNYRRVLKSSLFHKELDRLPFVSPMNRCDIRSRCETLQIELVGV
jgi:hypothetical protein